MSEIKPENYTVSPGLAQNLTQVEVNTNTIPPLQTVSGKDYPRYSILAYNVNENGISDINPENYKVSPGLAQNLTYVEVDTSVIPALSGVHGVYPRYAQLVYLLNPSSGGGSTGTSNYNQLSNKPSINGVTLQGNLNLSDFGAADNTTIDTVVSSLTGARVNQSAKTRFSFTNTSSQVTSAFELNIPKYDWMPGGFFVAAELKSFFSDLGGPTYVDQLTYEDWLERHPEGYDYFTEENGPYLVTSFYNYGAQTDSTIIIELNVVCLGPYLKTKTPETIFTTEISANTPTNIKLSSTGGLSVDNNTLNNITINLYLVSGNNISTKTIQFIAYNKNNNILISNAIIGDINSIGDSSFVNNLDISSIDNLIELEVTSLYDSISYVSIKQTTIKIR